MVLDGGDDARVPLDFGSEATLVSINVVLDSSGVQKGSGVLTKTAGFWKGPIHVSESGTMRFMATAGFDEGKVQVDWFGNTTLVMGTSGKLAIGIGVPTTPVAGATSKPLMPCTSGAGFLVV